MSKAANKNESLAVTYTFATENDARDFEAHRAPCYLALREGAVVRHQYVMWYKHCAAYARENARTAARFGGIVIEVTS